jgi:lysine N6-hydroxylase
VLSSDGVTESLLGAIYRRLYILDYVEQRPFTHEILGGHRLTGLRDLGGRYEATIESNDFGETFAVQADAVVMATGYVESVPSFLAPLKSRIHLDDGGFVVARDFSVAWDGPEGHRIFVQGGARRSHGVADPNLSLAAWRAAVILNGICGREVYPVESEGIDPRAPAAACGLGEAWWTEQARPDGRRLRTGGSRKRQEPGQRLPQLRGPVVKKRGVVAH